MVNRHTIKRRRQRQARKRPAPRPSGPGFAAVGWVAREAVDVLSRQLSVAACFVREP